MDQVSFFLEHLDTATGHMLLISDEQGQVRALDWQDHEARLRRLLGRYYRAAPLVFRDAPRASAASRALTAYFDGQLAAITSVRVATNGTAFQNQVWAALRGIPHGRTLSYGALAASIGRPKAVRAVGLANGQNPIAIIVPCHRVIGADSSLTGYASGLERKRWLLEHEGARHPRFPKG